MGFNIQIPDAIFDKNIGNIIPSGDNLVGYWLFSGTLQESIINRISGISGILVGAPAVSNGKIATDKTKGFITDVAISGEKTFIAIAKFTPASILLSSINYDALPETSDGIAVFDSKPMIQLNSASKPQSANKVNTSNIHFVAGTLGASSNSLYVSKNGLLTKEDASHTESLVDNMKLRIGGWGVNSTSLVGSTETYAAMVFNKKLSALEVQDVFYYLKKTLKDIVVD